MNKFSDRKDRFDFFEAFEKPQLNICFELEVPDFTGWCKRKQLPVFHTFLHAVCASLTEIENFRYRIFQGTVITIDTLSVSYTVLNEKGLFNYTRLDFEADLHSFIRRSLEAKDVAVAAPALINSGFELGERELKNSVFITCLPWLRFTAIDHPAYRLKSADIPAIAWGKFTPTDKGTLLVPIAVQAHHGFVDGYHIHLLGEAIRERLAHLITQKRGSR